MHRWLVGLAVLGMLFLVSSRAIAGDFVCGDATKLERFTPSVDPTQVPPCPAPFVLLAPAG